MCPVTFCQILTEFGRQNLVKKIPPPRPNIKFHKKSPVAFSQVNYFYNVPVMSKHELQWLKTVLVCKRSDITLHSNYQRLI